MFDFAKKYLSTEIENIQSYGKPTNATTGFMNNLSHVIVEQQVHWEEVLLCCNQPNTYRIYETNKNYAFSLFPEPPTLLATYKEQSSFCYRQLARSARQFRGVLQSHTQQLLASTMCEYKCHSCINCITCPCDRPVMQVADSFNKLAAKIQVPCYGPLCCTRGDNKLPLIEMDIFDAQESLKYQISARCCQPSVLCFPFQKCGCERIQYNILDKSNNIVGTIDNIYTDSIQEVCSTADRFGITFPEGANFQDKIIIILASIYLDYLQYKA